MHFVIFRERSRERSQRTSGPISEYALLHWKLKLELRSSTNVQSSSTVAKITVERGWRVNKKCLRRFGADQKIASS